MADAFSGTIPPRKRTEENMTRLFAFSMTLLLLTAPAVAQEIHIDYDRWARFTTFKTFAWYPTDETSLLGVSDMMHEHIKNAIITQLSSGRLKQVDEDPDLYVTYHTSAREAMRLDTTYWGYGFPSSWYWDPYWGGMGMTTTTAHTYTEGILIVDIWNAREETLVWRGSAIAAVSPDPAKNRKKVDKAIKKLAKKWENMKPGF
jgi:hypothetical protein